MVPAVIPTIAPICGAKMRQVTSRQINAVFKKKTHYTAKIQSHINSSSDRVRVFKTKSIAKSKNLSLLSFLLLKAQGNFCLPKHGTLGIALIKWTLTK